MVSSITNQATTKLSSLYERGAMFEGSIVVMCIFPVFIIKVL